MSNRLRMARCTAEATSGSSITTTVTAATFALVHLTTTKQNNKFNYNNPHKTIAKAKREELQFCIQCCCLHSTIRCSSGAAEETHGALVPTTGVC